MAKAGTTQMAGKAEADRRECGRRRQNTDADMKWRDAEGGLRQKAEEVCQEAAEVRKQQRVADGEEGSSQQNVERGKRWQKAAEGEQG